MNRLVRSRLAWAVTAYFAVLSMIFYTVNAWLPTMLIEQGRDADAGGQLLTVVNLVAIPFALVVSILVHRARSQVWATTIGSIGLGLGDGGLILWSGRCRLCVCCVVRDWLWHGDGDRVFVGNVAHEFGGGYCGAWRDESDGGVFVVVVGAGVRGCVARCVGGFSFGRLGCGDGGAGGDCVGAAAGWLRRGARSDVGRRVEWQLVFQVTGCRGPLMHRLVKPSIQARLAG